MTDPRHLPCLAAARAAAPHLGDLELSAVVRAVIAANDQYICDRPDVIEWDSPLAELGPAVEWETDLDDELRELCESDAQQDDLNADLRVVPPEEMF